jgi:phospholipase C
VDPCGVRPAPAHFAHVVWIWMENHSYDSIVGSSDAPYINGLARRCGLATNSHNITHPSLPNYIAATSGLALSDLGPFASDCSPSSRCSTAASSIFDQGESWKAYQESMPSNCDDSNAGDYAVRHNPPPYYSALAGCPVNDVPYPHLAIDLKAGTLPAFSFVTPDLNNDMHNGTVADGDHWLALNLGAILDSATYHEGTTAIFLTWDEGEGGSSNDCATNTTDVGCHVATVVISPSTPAASTSGVLFNHYSLLATAEQLLGLPPLGQAASATTMTAAFGL